VLAITIVAVRSTRREPKRFPPPGGVLTSSIEGLGELQNHFVPGFGYPVSPGEG
jgi:hypothetical protein